MLASSKVCVRESLRASFNWSNGKLLVLLTPARHGSAVDHNIYIYLAILGIHDSREY